MTLDLAPDLAEAKALLAETADTWMRLQLFTERLNDAEIGDLDDRNPDWLTEAQDALKANVAAGVGWLDAAPAIKAAMVAPLIDYAAGFAAFAKLAVLSDSRDGVRELKRQLAEMSAKIDEALAALRAGTAPLQQVVAAFAEPHAQMIAATEAATIANASEQEEIVATAVKIATLEQTIADLGVEISSGIIDDEETIVENQIDILYGVAIGASEIPFVGIGLVVISLTVSILEDVLSSVEVNNALTELRQALADQFVEAQAASALHAILGAFTRLDDLYERAMQPGPHLEMLWEREKDKLARIVEALDAHARPTEMQDLRNLADASATWAELARFGEKLLALDIAGTKSATLVASGPVGRPAMEETGR